VKKEATMTRKLFLASLVVLAAIPAAAFAGSSSVTATASKQCITAKSMLGPTRFVREFGSFGGCVSSLTPLAQQNASTAAALCRTERASAGFAATHGGKKFAWFYGKGNPKIAYSRCVAAKELISSQGALGSLSKCYAMQTDASFPSSHGGKTFAQFWGSNAFATCLAQKAGPTYTVQPVQPSTAPTAPAPDTKVGTTPVPPCGPVQAGVPRPLVCE